MGIKFSITLIGRYVNPGRKGGKKKNIKRLAIRPSRTTDALEGRLVCSTKLSTEWI